MQTNQQKNDTFWNLESGEMQGVGVIHKTDIIPTLLPLQDKLKINLIDNLLGSAGKRTFSGDIDIAIKLEPDLDIHTLVEKLNKIPQVKQIKLSKIIMTSVEIPDWDSEKYKNTDATGLVQIDFMMNEDIELLKLFYHSPDEGKSKYKGIYRNILLGAIAHYFDIKYSSEMLLDNIPLYEERYFWSADLGLYRGKKYKILSKDRKSILKKTTNIPIDGKSYKKDVEIVKQLNLSSIDSLYSFENLYEDINKRYNDALVNDIITEFLNNRYVKYYGIPSEITLNKEAQYES